MQVGNIQSLQSPNRAKSWKKDKFSLLELEHPSKKRKGRPEQSNSSFTVGMNCGDSLTLSPSLGPRTQLVGFLGTVSSEPGAEDSHECLQLSILRPAHSQGQQKGAQSHLCPPGHRCQPQMAFALGRWLVFRRLNEQGPGVENAVVCWPVTFGWTPDLAGMIFTSIREVSPIFWKTVAFLVYLCFHFHPYGRGRRIFSLKNNHHCANQ